MARTRTALWTLGGIATVVAALGLTWRTSDLGRAAADLENQRSAAKRAGVPTHWNDIRALTPAVAFDDNAATLYRQAFGELARPKGLRSLKSDRLLEALVAGDAKPSDLAEARAVLESAGPLLEEAKAASRRRGFSYDRAWEKGAALLLPEFSDAKTVARSLVVRAVLADDPASAVEDLRAAARMRAQFGAEPLLIGSLVGNAMEADVHRGLRLLAARGGSWPNALAPVLDDLGPIPSLRRSLTSEAIWSLRFDDEIAKAGANAFTDMGGGPAPLTMRLMAFGPVRDASKARIFEYWAGVWSKLPADPSDYRAAGEALKTRPDTGPSYAMLQFFVPVFDGFAKSNAHSEADRRLSHAALALWRGETPALPKDPFSEGLLRLKRAGSAWTLYSVGPDRTDDGGKPGKDWIEKGGDLVVRSAPTAAP